MNRLKNNYNQIHKKLTCDNPVYDDDNKSQQQKNHSRYLIKY
jgi:hypothetical protein